MAELALVRRDQLLAEIWCGETTEQNVPEKIEGEPEHNRCEPAVAQKKPALEYVGEIKRPHRQARDDVAASPHAPFGCAPTMGMRY